MNRTYKIIRFVSYASAIAFFSGMATFVFGVKMGSDHTRISPLPGVETAHADWPALSGGVEKAVVSAI